MTSNHPHQPQPDAPIVILDVAPEHSHLSAAPASSRVARAAATTRANIVRLVPGLTRLPLDTRPTLAPSLG